MPPCSPGVRKLHWLRIVLAACLCLLLHSAKAQQPFIRDWWLNDTNTPVKVNDLVQDTTGYIWLATDAGVYRFNGYSFTQMEDTFHHPATAVYTTGSSVYVGYSTGRIATIFNDTVREITYSAKHPDAAITSFAKIGDCLGFGTKGAGIWFLYNGGTFTITTDKGLSDDYVYAISLLPDGNLLAATDRGLDQIYKDGGKLSVRVLLAENIVQALRHSSKYPWLYMLGTNEGLWKSPTLFYDPDYRSETVSRNIPVNDFAFLSNKEVIIATESGKIYDAVLDKSIDNYVPIDSFTLTNKKPTKLLRDNTGNLWIATTQGLTMATSGTMGYVKLPPPYQLQAVTNMTYTPGAVWYTQNNDLYKYNIANHTIQFVLHAPVNITTVNAAANRLWIGTLGQGIWAMDTTGKLYRPAGTEAFSDTHVLDIAASGDKLWLATLNGVEELTMQGGNTLVPYKHHSKQSGIGSDYVYQIYPDRQGNIWMATDGAGICCYNGTTYQHWDASSGFNGKVVYSITEDASGTIWAATLEKGLFAYRNGKWQGYGRAQGLQDVNISSLAANNAGQVLIVNDKGIDIWMPAGQQFRHINRRLAMDIDSTSHTLNSTTADAEGNVYIPFEDGIVRFDNMDTALTAHPSIVVKQVRLPGYDAPPGQYRFAADENNLTFRYEGINFINPERLNYRYKLLNYNKDWIYTNDEAATFPQLPPGDYTFVVEAAFSASFTHAACAAYTFHIDRPYWKRWWFILLILAAITAIILIAIRVRERNIRKLAQLQKDRLQAEHEHLKSQVNPHFLFNSLNTLVALIDEDGGRAIDYTVALSDLYRSTLHHRNQDLISLAEEWHILQQYLHIQKTRFGTALKLSGNIPDTILQKKIVPLALQLIVENAIKHNIVAQSQPLTITITATESKLTISNPLQLKMTPEKGTGIGLANIQSRYGMLHRYITFGVVDNEYIVTLPLL